MNRLNSEHLAEFVRSKQIQAQLVHIDVPTPTVESAAKAVGTNPDRVIKSLVFLVNGEPVLVIASGIQLVDRRIIARHFEVGRKKVKLADAQTVQDATGFEIGAVPPIGHLNPLMVLIDKRVLQYSTVYGGGGSIDVLLKLDPNDILKLTDATIIDLSV